jgi:DNA repair ATPase RecN
LKHTLVDSQQEMDTLVSKYDQAVEDLIKRDHKISKMTDDLVEAGREIEKLLTSNTELKTKTDS